MSRFWSLNDKPGWMTACARKPQPSQPRARRARRRRQGGTARTQLDSLCIERSMQIVLFLQIGPEQSSILPPRDRRSLNSWKTVLRGARASDVSTRRSTSRREGGREQGRTRCAQRLR